MALREMLSKIAKSGAKDEEQVRKESEKFGATYGKDWQDVPEEPGIEEDYTVEDTASMMLGGVPGVVRTGGRIALDKMRNAGPPDKQPSVNKALASTSDAVRAEAKRLMDAGVDAQEALRRAEQLRSAQVQAAARGTIGAKFKDQKAKVRSSERGKLDSGQVLTYSPTGVTGRKRRPGEEQ